MIVVLGSLNMDFVVRVERLPAPGETVLGGGFQTLPGGKGANQACAAGKLAAPGSAVRMIGCTGYDAFGDQLRASLSAAGVDVGAVRSTRSAPTGIAMIWVDAAGQNSIIVAPGSNAALTAREAESFREIYRGAKHALFQLETPLDAVEAAMKIAREEGAEIVLDPAPAQPLPANILAEVSLLTPNESEACALLGIAESAVSAAEAPGLARRLLALGPQAVVLKLGAQGCYYADASRQLHVPGFPVEAVDTTAAGDTFNAALAVALSEGQSIENALRFANAAAAISVTRAGAQTSAPTRREVDDMLARY